MKEALEFLKFKSWLSKYDYRKYYPLFGIFGMAVSHVGKRNHFFKNSWRKIFILIAYSFVNHVPK